MKLTSSQQELAEKNIRLAYSRANYWKFLNFEFEDIISASTLGLTKAAKTFKSDKGIKFSTFCYRAIDNEILKMIRDSKAGKRSGIVLSLNHITVDDKEVEELIGECDDYKIENHNLINRLLATLDEREREIIELYFFREMNQEKIGDRYNISQVHVSRIIKRTLEKLKEEHHKQQ